MAGKSDYRTLRAAGLSSAEAETHVINVLAGERALEVRRLVEGRLGVYRTYRPTWALVLAIVLFPFVGIGLLFLLVKATESGEVLVVDGPTGPQITLPPVVPRAVDGDLRAALGFVSAMPGDHLRADRTAEAHQRPAKPTPSVTASMTPISAVPGTAPAPPVEQSPLADVPAPTAAHSIGSDEDGLEDATVHRSVTASPGARSAESGVLQFDDGAVLVYRDELVVVGRAPGASDGTRSVSVPGDAQTVSKAHATLRLSDIGCEVTDLHSSNGTFIERSGSVTRLLPETASALADGDVLVLGDVRARFSLA